MPKVYLTKEQEREDKVTKILKTALIDNNTNQRALTKETNMSYSTFCKRIRSPGTFRLDELWKILDELNVPDEERVKMLI